MFFKTCATLALATGFAAAKPISARTPQELPAYSKRNNAFGGVNALGGQGGFNFIDGFNNFNNQQQVIQIQEQNLQIIDNGFQQQVVQQVNEVLIIDQQQNGFNNDLNNLFRKSNFRNNFQDQSTVMLVVQEIQVSVDNGFGGQFQQSLFAQSAVVANRGRQATQTVMVFSAETLIAQNVINGVGGFQNFQNGIGKNQFQNKGNNNGIQLPTQTANVQLFGSKPTWSSVAEDPAATLGGVWQAELEDAQKAENNNGDNEVNNQAAEQEKKALDEAKAAEEAAQQQEGEEQNQEGEEAQNQEEQQAQEGEAEAEQQQEKKN